MCFSSGQPVSRILSILVNQDWVIICLGRMSPYASCGLPGAMAFFRKPEDEQPPGDFHPHCPCLALLPAGVAWPRPLLEAPVVSYTAFSP